ncbi:MAG TPA: hypothetical protein VNQ76_15320 [Planctomicrobium sp.]|nr:hypothetical protein [Planctomicrobium sp.]
MVETIKKKWPDDAVMLVAEIAGHENRAKMEEIRAGRCRHCNQTVHYDSRTLRDALKIGEPYGMPVKFFCVPCAVEHDFQMINVLVDHRK